MDTTVDVETEALKRASQRRPCGERCCRLLLFILTPLVVAAVAVTLLLFPHLPTYSVCSHTVDFLSVLKGIVHLNARADVEVSAGTF
jgi:hypothetical protein